MNGIKDVNEDAHKWLMDLPLHTWARHKFDQHVKNDHVINNITESFNNWYAHKWLMDFPLHTWARHKFDQHVKNDHVINNITESFNIWLVI
ncbi:hypothetical protein U1Q18_052435 [Sarracenia purpurea var. burkii]